MSATTPTREGYSFTGWDTAADGSGTDYAAGSSYTLPASGTDTLYAQWDPNTVTLAYGANGGSGAPGDQSGDAFSDVTVSATTPTREGYSFKGWDTAADGSGVDYPAGSSYTLPASGTDTLYAQWDPNTVTLAYSANGGSGAPGDQSGDAFSDVTVSATTPTREGYSFTGWNTAADGTGTDYAAGSSYTLPASGTDTLYAQWDPNTVTLAYDANGGSGAPGDQSGDAFSDVTVSDTTPTREGYSFTGWNTAADGTGVDYAADSSYTLPASGTDTLYAQWNQDVVGQATLAYSANGGSGAPGDQSGDASSDVTVSATTPTREGYSFTGWNTAADGSGTSYAGNDSYTLPASGTDTLYAQWDPNTVTLAYGANGGSGAPGDQSGDAFSDVTVSDTTPTREGYSFTGWNTAADGTGVDYPADSTYTLPASGTDTLYAQWDPNTVTLAYDANGGSGAPNDQSGDAFSDVTVSDTTPTREGYSFTGWNTAADGTGTDYAAGSSYTLPASGTDTLYAQWDPNTVTLAYDANGGSGAPGDQSGDAFSDVTVSATTPTREGYSFTGWNTAADGTGVDYPAGSSYTLPASGTDTLYAQWNQDQDPPVATLPPESEPADPSPGNPTFTG